MAHPTRRDVLGAVGVAGANLAGCTTSGSTEEPAYLDSYETGLERYESGDRRLDAALDDLGYERLRSADRLLADADADLQASVAAFEEALDLAAADGEREAADAAATAVDKVSLLVAAIEDFQQAIDAAESDRGRRAFQRHLYRGNEDLEMAETYRIRPVKEIEARS